MTEPFYFALAGGKVCEVFWDDDDTPEWGGQPRNFDADGKPVQAGWYWWHIDVATGEPITNATGPFGTPNKAVDSAVAASKAAAAS